MLYLISGLFVKIIPHNINVTLRIILYFKGFCDISSYVLKFIKQANGHLTLEFDVFTLSVSFALDCDYDV